MLAILLLHFAEAKDAFVIFDENYEGDNVDAFYLGDICRALGCNCTNSTLKSVGMSDELGEINRSRLGSPENSDFELDFCETNFLAHPLLGHDSRQTKNRKIDQFYTISC